MDAVKGCEICGGTGWIEWEDDNGYLFAKPCKCELERRYKERLQQSNLSKAEEQTFDTYNARYPWQIKIKESAEKYTRDVISSMDPARTAQPIIAPWFYIGGQVGAGKTHICTAICSELINAGKWVRYDKWPDVAASLKGLRNTAEFSAKMSTYTTAKVLYLDDLFKGSCTKSDIQLAWQLIDARYAGGRPTIISSEMFSNDLIRLDEALGSRIKEMARGYMHNLIRDRERNQRMTG